MNEYNLDVDNTSTASYTDSEDLRRSRSLCRLIDVFFSGLHFALRHDTSGRMSFLQDFFFVVAVNNKILGR